MELYFVNQCALSLTMVFSEEDNSNGCNKNLKLLLELMFPDCMVRCTMDIKRRSGRNY